MKPPRTTEIPKTYEASRYEDEVYTAWEQSGGFNPDSIKGRKKAFCIVMPPPNTTGQLHLGHAAAITYEDFMIRYKRMRGYRTLYLPGTDHAAIATQNKVEKLLATEGVKRADLGRERFLDRVREYVRESQGVIKNQIRRTGASCDWSREAYTFDEVSSRVVNEVFIKMYQDGLVYRGTRIVNWCIRCNSVLANDEVEYVTRRAPFYYLKYGPVVIGTARPETKFQDKAIIVHPDDVRYAGMVGAEFDVPWIEGEMKARVVADSAADPELGTGAMTITPAHSFEDFDLAQKYNLEVIQIIGPDGKLTEAAGSMAGMDVEEARKKVIATLKKKGLVDRIDENYEHNLSICYRCQTPIQPLVSKQWFVDVNKKIPGRWMSLKDLAIQLVRSNDIEIIPERFRKVYFHWVESLHDWCISRQIWWGHRIPVWYCIPCHDDPKKYDAGEYWMIGEEKPATCPRCGVDAMHQDHDTLDTWFSSATWTFSTLLDRDRAQYRDLKQWLKKSADFKTFHPTAVLETGYDILFFWVARMVLITSYVTGEKPFSHVYLHGLVRDKEGRKMSKSLGNGIDPSEMIDKYGADALRLSLVVGSAPGQDMRLYDEKIAGYRNFVNKLWNISRFIVSTVGETPVIAKRPRPMTDADAWILHRLDETVAGVTGEIEAWRFSLAGERLYAFTWSEFADWYLEVAKIQRSESPDLAEHTDTILLYVVQEVLALWHPFAPFVTEVLWRSLGSSEILLTASWPAERKAPKPSNRVESFIALQELVTAIRKQRAERGVAAQEVSRVVVRKSAMDVRANRAMIERLARCALTEEAISGGEEVRTARFVFLIDTQKRTSPRADEKLKRYIESLERKLANKDFLKKAPAEVVEQERKKLAEAKARLP